MGVTETVGATPAVILNRPKGSGVGYNAESLGCKTETLRRLRRLRVTIN